MRVVGVVWGMALLGLTGCASTTSTTLSATPHSAASAASGTHSAPSSPTVSSPAGAATVAVCGTVRASTRRWATRLRLTISAPPTARSAAVVHPQVMVSATGGSYRFSASFPVHTYTVRGRTIVGYFTGFTAGTGYDNVITRTPVPLDAAIVFMRGCPAVDGSTSMTDRPPLPPGRYGLVAYVRGGGPQERQLLVSTPFPITVVR